MHLRFSHCVGFPVMEEGQDHVLGTISGILIVPDTGKIEGFFVHVHSLVASQALYLSSFDIVRWGTRVYVRSQDVLAPAEDRIRLQDLLRDPRCILGQKIRTESGVTIGTCKDIQFNTESMHVEWLFPKKWFRWGIALPISDVIEVRPEAIIIKDPMRKEFVDKQASIGAALQETEPAVACTGK